MDTWLNDQPSVALLRGLVSAQAESQGDRVGARTVHMACQNCRNAKVNAKECSDGQRPCARCVPSGPPKKHQKNEHCIA